MLIRKLDPAAFVHAYNVDLQLLYPWEGVVAPPFGAAWAVLAPGESTKPHAHQECETFFIARGVGEMAIGEERIRVEAGDVTFHQPFDNHTLTNTSREELLFLTVWWEDRALWGGAEGNGGGAAAAEHDTTPATGTAATAAAAAVRPETARRVLVTAAPPTPNGDLHLGHLAGPYLSADLYARALRLRGVEADFVTGSDDNSIYVKTKGEEIGLGPQAAADRFASACEETLAAAGIDLAAFPRPNASPYHVPLVREFFRALHDRGHLVAREAPAPWCERCDRYLFESGIRGRCPHCGEGVVGNTCEECGRVNDCVDLVDAACTACGTAPGRRPVRRLVFPLARHAGALSEFYRHVAMAPRLRALCERVLAEGPPEVAVTHPTDWGIEVPVPGWEEQRIYVWLEMAPRYLAYARRLAAGPGGGAGERGPAPVDADWPRWWKAPDARVVQFFGFDNSFYYGMLVPALLLAYDPEIRLPAAFVTNEFYRLDGLKFSTSREHRILGRDLLGKAPRDAVRYYLAATCPEREETNFTLADFDAAVARELLGHWEPWLADFFARLARNFDGAVPATGDWTGEQRRFYHRLQALLAAAEAAYEAEGFSPQRAARTMGELVREARRFGRGERHWRGVAGRGEERRTAIALEALAAKLLGLIAAPVMPEFADRLWRALGYAAGPGPGSWAEALAWMPAGQRAAEVERPFFRGLDAYLAARRGEGGR